MTDLNYGCYLFTGTNKAWCNECHPDCPHMIRSPYDVLRVLEKRKKENKDDSKGIIQSPTNR